MMKLQRLRSQVMRVDAFARPDDHLIEKTPSGGIVTIVGVALITILFCHELIYYTIPQKEYVMGVDLSQDKTLSVYLNFTFPSLPCSILSVDSQDVSGSHEVDIRHEIWKTRLDSTGYPLKALSGDRDDEEKEGDVTSDVIMFGFASQEELERLERKVKRLKAHMASGEGCNVHGRLRLARVSGNFHVSVHGTSMLVLQQVFGDAEKVNVSHVVHTLGFGPQYPGRHDPLEGFARILHTHEAGTFKYFLKVVPTTYTFLRGPEMQTNQYSVSEYYSALGANGDNSIPAVYFVYDISPIAVTIKEKRRQFFHFLTNLCAVIGGSFALAGMLDRWILIVVRSMESHYIVHKD